MISRQQKTALIYAVPCLLMATAFFAGLFAEGWNWTASDFATAAALLFGAAFFINLAAVSQKPFFMKLMICLSVILVLVLIWIELAVGIFGSPFAGN
ncbi:hypothetical protein [uncultured Chryseobacterium sp.]|uniref:hypothetical protein n=1 Tax=uncultured Chryseobacterium sp. TaxID=259322 RepID=UPI002600CC51|nr:hypothetical protein [uncultured Chryseobacterium sp.]